jgi:hypothetical protein
MIMFPTSEKDQLFRGFMTTEKCADKRVSFMMEVISILLTQFLRF